jgi:hypothetical protein
MDRQLITYIAPNIVVNWLTLVLNIREFLGSNLSSETGNPDRFFMLFFSTFSSAGIVP